MLHITTRTLVSHLNSFQIYIGNKQCIRLSEVERIELNDLQLTKRGESLFKLITKESLGLYSLTAQKKMGKKAALKVIPPTVVVAMKSKFEFQSSSL